MLISRHHTQWIWTPLLGWALLSCATPVALAQAPAATPQGGATSTTSPGTTPSQGTTLAPSDVTAIIPGADTPAIDPTTGLPMIDTDNQTVKSSITPTAPRAQLTTLPAITPQNNTGTSISGPSVITTTSTPALNDVQSLPSATTTIIGAPFGSSGFVTTPVSANNSGSAASTNSELGITVGSFRLFPAIEINVGVDSNVFAQNPAQGPTVGSLYTTIAPSLELRSDWLNHELHLLMNGTIGEYASAPTQNYQNYGLELGGKIDIDTDFYATWSIGYKQSTEALGTPNAALASSPTVDNTLPVSLGLFQQIGQFFYQATATAARQTFTDNSVISSAGLPAASRDITTYIETLRLGYDMTEDFALFVEPSLNQRHYLNPINTAGQSRDSDGQTLNFGVSYKPTRTTHLDATVGYTTQAYQDPTVGTNGSFTYGLSGSWNAYDPLTIRPTIARSIAESSLANFGSFVSTTYGVDFNYLIHDAWTAVGGLSLTTADFAPVAGTGATARTDFFWRAQIGLLYSLRPQLQIGPTIEYDLANTTDPTNGTIYDREIFSVRLIARR
jgi:hypothetical protein